MKIDDLKEKLFDLNESIMNLIKECKYEKNYIPEMDYDMSNLEEYTMYQTFVNIFTHLDYISLLLDYIQKPIKEEGEITISSRGKYKLNKTILHRNDFIEILRYEDENEDEPKQGYWDLTYVGGLFDLEGRYGRIRKSN